MSKVSTLSQAAGILTLLDEQGLDLDQIQTIRPYLALLAKGIKNGRLPDIKVFRALAEGRAKVEIEKYIIDFDKPPSIPPGWEILPDSEQLPNRVKGLMGFDSAKIALHLDKGQKDSNVTEGDELRNKLKDIPVYGAQLLDFYLDNPHLIPEEWKGRAVFFWGTIYRNTNGRRYVRCSYWLGMKWNWYYSWLGNDWGDDNPAVRFAS